MVEIREGRIDPPPPPSFRYETRGYLPGWAAWLLAPLIVIALGGFLFGAICGHG